MRGGVRRKLVELLVCTSVATAFVSPLSSNNLLIIRQREDMAFRSSHCFTRTRRRARGGDALQQYTSGEAEELEPHVEDMLEDSGPPIPDYIPRINTVMLIGRVGNDLDPQFFVDGKVKLSFSLAVKREYHPIERKLYGIKWGEEATDWFRIEMWGSNAENAPKFVSKGARISVRGSLAANIWDDAKGEQKRSYKIVAEQYELLETYSERTARENGRVTPNTSRRKSPPQTQTQQPQYDSKEPLIGENRSASVNPLYGEDELDLGGPPRVKLSDLSAEGTFIGAQKKTRGDAESSSSAAPGAAVSDETLPSFFDDF